MLAASGYLSLPLENARQLLAASATWRSWTGTSSAAAAAERVHLIAPAHPDGTPFTLQELEDLRPFAVVALAPGFRCEKRGTGNTYRNAGRVLVRIEAPVSERFAENERDAELEFLNNLGAVIQELAGADEGAGYLVPLAIGIEEEIQRGSWEGRETEGDYFVAQLAIEWDGGGAA